MKNNFILLIPLLMLTAAGYTPANAGTAVDPPAKTSRSGCAACHTDIRLDNSHSLSCSSCHQGDPLATDKKTAHRGLVPAPAAPENMAAGCGQCHPDQLAGCGQSLHFTLKKAVNAVRSHFGIQPPLKGLTRIPESAVPGNTTELVDDMLRRQCLRCHVYTAGDSYPYVRRGTGCAACHLQYTDGKLQSHAFTPPTERRCLSCHYGNHVGSDYVGSYEHDFNWEYRTPYTTRDAFMRPYGVELHQLSPDIHSKRGLTCLDCHSGEELSDRRQPVRCIDCHAPGRDALLPDQVRRDTDQLILHSTADDSDHVIPQLRHPAHARYGEKITCQVCHAQWGFNDRATHLLLSYSDDVDPWDRLTVQSNSAVETFLDHNLYSDEDELDTTMLDSINGRSKDGIWYMGYTQRRWEDLLIDRDSDGMIKVFRPILDLRISAVDSDGEPLFDNVQGSGSGLLPYTPHTTGPAGLFYEQRFQRFLAGEQAKPDNKK